MLGKGGLVWKLRRLPLVMKLFSHLNAAHNFTQRDVLTRRMTKRQLRIEKWLRLPLPMKDGQGETPPVRLVVGSHPSPTPRNGAETNERTDRKKRNQCSGVCNPFDVLKLGK